MNTLTITASAPFSLKRICASLIDRWDVEVYFDPDKLVLKGVRSNIYMRTELDSDVEGRYILEVDYSDVELVKQILIRIANSPSVTVDDEFDTILPGSEFVAKIIANKEWNWREEYYR